MTAYLSAREAADYCGVSEKTVRNWLASGRLQAEKSAGSFRIPQDQLDTLKRNVGGSPQGAERQPEAEVSEVRTPGPQVFTVEDVLRLVREVQADAMSKAESAAMWQARAEMLAAQLDQAQLALEAPKAEPVATEPTPAIEAVSEPVTRPWWRRFW